MYCCAAYNLSHCYLLYASITFDVVRYILINNYLDIIKCLIANLLLGLPGDDPSSSITSVEFAYIYL